MIQGETSLFGKNCTIAHRLTEKTNAKVLLLEAGGTQSAIYNDIPVMYSNITAERPDLQWSYLNEPQENAGKQYTDGLIPEFMGKNVGGSSTHNDMVFNRGNPKDYDNWAHTYGAKGWSFREVLPFFKRFENNTDSAIVERSQGYHGTDGPIQVRSEQNLPKMMKIMQKVFNGLGFENTDINGPKQSGTMIIQSTIDSNGLRSSNANAYFDPNRNPHNLHIVTKAQVLKILFRGKTAVGVEFDRNGELYRVNARKEVILTAGL